MHRSPASLLLAIWLCAGTMSLAAAEAPGEKAGSARPSLVLITLDTTRADHLGSYGWRHARTPQLDALAARGTRFERCDSAAPITLPSHATLLTGLQPPRHSVRDNALFVLPEEVGTVAERLAGAGWDAGAAISAVVLARRYGLDRGFRIYDDDLGGDSERTATATTDAALALLPQLKAPYLLWVHYFDPHSEYEPPAGFRDLGGPHPAYDGEIAYMDAEIGRLLAALPASARVVVVGDHGEMLGEQGEPEHGLLLARGARRVPLFAAGPGIAAGRTVDCLVRTADVAPTLLELAGLTPPAGLDGESLLPLVAAGSEAPGAGCDRQAYSESFLPFFAYRWYPLRALSDGRWLYIHGTYPSLYDLAADPAEANDLANAQPARVSALRGRLDALLDEMGEQLDEVAAPTRLPTSAESEQLAALGYLGGGAGETGGNLSGELPDPRKMTGVAQEIAAAQQLLESGQPGPALKKLYAVIERDPGNFPALNLSGLALRTQERWGAALNAFDAAAAINPRSAVPVLNGAGCLAQLGRRPEAEQRYARALELDPTAPGAASNLALLRRERGDAAGARQAIETAFAAGSHHPGLYLERAMLSAAAGDLPAAFADFKEAARRDPDNPLPLDNAAKAAVLLERYEEAIELYQRLTRLYPERPDLWATMAGIAHNLLGDREAARRYLQEAIRRERDEATRQQLEELLRQLQ